MIKLFLSALLALLLGTAALAQTAPPVAQPASAPRFSIAPVDDAWRARLPRDAAAATQAYLDRLPADVLARSNSYYEGGYWLQLWNLLLGLGIAALMLSGRRAARLRDWAQRRTRLAWLRDALFGAVYAGTAWLLGLPLTIYEGFVREHAYGMATQAFPAWFGEQLMQLAVSLLITALAVSILYAVIRRAGARWWAWGTVTGMAMLVFMLMLSPLLIEPLFNTYKPVEDGPVKTAVLKMAHANGVPVDNIYEFDASRQTTRVSANVSGLFGTAAVRLNDNLLRRASEPEIRAVMGHELGHYVMNHIPKLLVDFGLVLFAGFLFANWTMGWLLRRSQARTGVERVDDVASLPLLAAVFSVFLALATPLLNTITRTQEIEADRFGLNLSAEPHGFAEAQLKLVEYRKADPGPVEEFVFFHHPSTRNRIFDAMRWREAMGTP